MHISLLCNAGLAIADHGATLLVDVPNETFAPFYALDDTTWDLIIHRKPPYDRVCGLFFTHTHADHCDRARVEAYRKKWPDVPCFLPEENPEKGLFLCGPFSVSYQRVAHAPMKEETPPLVITWIRAGEKSLYIGTDAKLDCDAHQSFLKGRKANAAFWISMYLSQPDTRTLMQHAAERNYIYHMPKEQPDGQGLWKKCERNYQRYGEELKSVTVMDHYPYEIEL